MAKHTVPLARIAPRDFPAFAAFAAAVDEAQTRPVVLVEKQGLQESRATPKR